MAPLQVMCVRSADVDGPGVRCILLSLVTVNGMLAERMCSDVSTREDSDVKGQSGKSGYLNLSGKFAVKLRVKILCNIWISVLLLRSQPSP